MPEAGCCYIEGYHPLRDARTSRRAVPCQPRGGPTPSEGSASNSSSSRSRRKRRPRAPQLLENRVLYELGSPDIRSTRHALRSPSPAARVDSSLPRQPAEEAFPRRTAEEAFLRRTAEESPPQVHRPSPRANPPGLRWGANAEREERWRAEKLRIEAELRQMEAEERRRACEEEATGREDRRSTTPPPCETASRGVREVRAEKWLCEEQPAERGAAGVDEQQEHKEKESLSGTRGEGTEEVMDDDEVRIARLRSEQEDLARRVEEERLRRLADQGPSDTIDHRDPFSPAVGIRTHLHTFVPFSPSQSHKMQARSGSATSTAASASSASSASSSSSSSSSSSAPQPQSRHSATVKSMASELDTGRQPTEPTADLQPKPYPDTVPSSPTINARRSASATPPHSGGEAEMCDRLRDLLEKSGVQQAEAHRTISEVTSALQERDELRQRLLDVSQKIGESRPVTPLTARGVKSWEGGLGALSSNLSSPPGSGPQPRAATPVDKMFEQLRELLLENGVSRYSDTMREVQLVVAERDELRRRLSDLPTVLSVPSAPLSPEAKRTGSMTPPTPLKGSLDCNGPFTTFERELRAKYHRHCDEVINLVRTTFAPQTGAGNQ